VVEPDDGHDDGGTFGKEEKNKNELKANVYVLGPFLFCTQDTIEGVSDLRWIVVLLIGEFLG
jgi:hypothetical protein